MHHQHRLNVLDNHQTLIGAIQQLVGGNIGAAIALGELTIGHKPIDPDNEPGITTYLILIDVIGIYDEDIAVLYKYICRSDVASFITVLWAVSFDFITRDAVLEACKLGPGYSKNTTINIPYLMERVRQRLPNFNKVN